MGFFTVKHQVREKLKTIPDTRDNDNLLIGLLLEELEPNDLEEMTAREFVNRIKAGNYGSLESIRRCRQALQEKCEDLRGDLWNKRHAMADEISLQLRFEF